MALAKKIKQGMTEAEDYKTGLVGEQMIVSAYSTMPIEKLEKLRFIMNKIIKKKKEALRVHEYKLHSDNNSINNIKDTKTD